MKHTKIAIIGAGAVGVTTAYALMLKDVASNPVDIMTNAVQKMCNLPPEQIIGSGTFLVSQRLREFIAGELNVAVSSVHGYILGEHGHSQFPV